MHSDQTLAGRLHVYPRSPVSNDEDGRVDSRELLRWRKLMLTDTRKPNSNKIYLQRLYKLTLIVLMWRIG